MYGKTFGSTYTGSMVGAGSPVFAVWGFVIANKDADQMVELNPVYLSRIIGDPVEVMQKAIDYLCSPDDDSRSQAERGKRLTPTDQRHLYYVVNGEHYDKLIRAEDRRRSNRESQQRLRDRERSQRDAMTDDDASANISEHHQKSAPTDTETDTDSSSTARARFYPPDSQVDEDDGSEYPKLAGKDLERAFAGLAEQLPTAGDRRALAAIIRNCPNATAWLSEIAVSLEGMHGPALTVKELGEVLRDYVGNGHHERPSFKHFRAYLRRPDRKRAEQFSGNGTGDNRAEAARILVQIKEMAERNPAPGASHALYIRKADVQKLGPRIFEAYEAVGGADRVLGSSGDKWGFLVRDFADLLKGGGNAQEATKA